MVYRISHTKSEIAETCFCKIDRLKGSINLISTFRLSSHLFVATIILCHADFAVQNRKRISFISTITPFCPLPQSPLPYQRSSSATENQRKASMALSEKWGGPTGEPHSLERLCSISIRACSIMNPLISAIYDELISSSSRGEGGRTLKKVKEDNSAYTIADGLVQRLLIDVLFLNVSFLGIVGEEDVRRMELPWDQVDGLMVPQHLQPLVDSTKSNISSLAKMLEDGYKNITVFIDPIDGTREFSTGHGEQCSVCIGFADASGKAVAGVVYRPLSKPIPTWAAGAKSENYADFNFANSCRDENGGLLTSNGSISPFVESLIDELNLARIKSGGAGNKMMMLLERSIQVSSLEENPVSVRSSMLYIQDRGVSRWDTCAAEAILEAFGGYIIKLDAFIKDEREEKRISKYKYLSTQTNLDFNSGRARLTKYNSDLSDIQQNQMAVDVNQVKPYSNLCGLVAFGKEWNTPLGRNHICGALRRAAKKNVPSYD